MARNRIKSFYHSVLLGAGVSLFTAFSYPPAAPPAPLPQVSTQAEAPVSERAAQELKPVKKFAGAQPVRVEAGPPATYNKFITEEFEGRKYVYIAGKYHLQNTQNLYVINGVKTYYLEKDPLVAEGVEKIENRRGPGAKALSQNSSVPIINHVKRARANIQEHNEMLKDLVDEE